MQVAASPPTSACKGTGGATQSQGSFSVPGLRTILKKKLKKNSRWPAELLFEGTLIADLAQKQITIKVHGSRKCRKAFKVRPSRSSDRVENELSCGGEAGNSPAKVHLGCISSNQIARVPCGSIQNPPGHSELPLNLAWRIQADGSRAAADLPRGVRPLWNAKIVLFCSSWSEGNNKHSDSGDNTADDTLFSTYRKLKLPSTHSLASSHATCCRHPRLKTLRAHPHTLSHTHSFFSCCTHATAAAIENVRVPAQSP